MSSKTETCLREAAAQLCGAVFLTCVALLAHAAPAAATTGGRQVFVWAEQQNSTVNQMYFPNANFMSPGPSAAPLVGVVRTGTGQYQVFVGQHDVTFAYQAQVVAYGSTNVRCKFFRRSDPDFGSCVDGNNPAWCSRHFVQCITPEGAAVNSKFVMWLSGRKQSNTPALRGPGAYFETANGGTSIAKNYRLDGNRYFEGAGFMSFNSSAGNPLPTVRRNSLGSYAVELPGLGTANPGIVQVTALGAGAAHCATGLPTTSGTKIILFVGCWAGATRADTDFILNYDQVVTRISEGHQGARGVGDRFDASFTPGRSFNSGGVVGGTGTNTAYRAAAGLYRMRHTQVGKTPSSAWVGAFANDGSYCKVELWSFSSGTGTDVFIRCFNAQGVLADSGYIETFQANVIAPD